MAKENKTEGIETLQLKNKILTILVIIMIIWQVIDFIRVNSVMDSNNRKAGQYSVDRIDDNIKDMQRDIQDLRDDMWDKADKDTVKNQIDDVRDFCRNYCSSW